MGCQSCAEKARLQQQKLNEDKLKMQAIINNQSAQRPNLRAIQPEPMENFVPLEIKDNSSRIFKLNDGIGMLKGKKYDVKVHSKHEVAVYVIGSVDNCVPCRFILKSLGLIMNSTYRKHMKFYLVEKQCILDNFGLKGIPTTLFVSRGEIKKVFTGGIPDLGGEIKRFFEVGVSNAIKTAVHTIENGTDIMNTYDAIRNTYEFEGIIVDMKTEVDTKSKALIVTVTYI
jgi:hypothetical protein